MLKERLPTNTVVQPSSFMDASRGASMGLLVENLMLSQRPPKSAPLCSRAAAAAEASLKSIIAVKMNMSKNEEDAHHVRKRVRN